MKSRHILIAVALVLTTAGTGRADFVLTGAQHLDVTTSHTTGVLFDASTADVLAGGYIAQAYVNDEALLRVMRPTGPAISTAWLYNSSRIVVSSGNVSSELYAYDTSSVAISGGQIDELEARGSSTVDVSGGSVPVLDSFDTSSVAISGGDLTDLDTRGASTADISGGSIHELQAYNASSVGVRGGALYYLYAYDTSGVGVSGGNVSYLDARETSSTTVSGGSVSELRAFDSALVYISGGSVPTVRAYDNSDITLHGHDFRATGGLSLVGDEVIGTGVLTGKWFDGTSWLISIPTHSAGATIRAIPEPASAMLLGFGAMFLARRRKQARQV